MGGKAKNTEKQFVFLGFWLGRRVWASSGLSWTMGARGFCFSEVFWTCWRQEGEQQGQDGDMMAPMGHDSIKMGIWSTTCEVLVEVLEHFSRIFGDGWVSEKHLKTLGFS